MLVNQIYYNGKEHLLEGRFRSQNGILINVGPNAAYNIIRKVFPDAFADGIRDAGLHPEGLSIHELINPLKVEEGQ